MFKERTTEEILRLITEAQEELLNRKKEEDIYYKVTIEKYVKRNIEEFLVFDVKTLDELVENIDEHIERMRPFNPGKREVHISK